MKTPLLILVLLLLLSAPHSDTYAWDSTAAKFYPLAVGNLWSYTRIDFAQFSCVPMYTSHYNVRIVSDTLMPNGRRYFKFIGTSYPFVRIDSATMNVYNYFSGTGNECLLDSLLARKNDRFRSCRTPSGFNRVIDTSLVNFAGSLRRTKQMMVDSMPGSFGHSLMYGIGMYHQVQCEGGGWRDTLTGCIINGIQYGQILSVQTHGENIPDKFSLSQNYPNPFNPKTIINFQLPISNYVKLTVYDILGREVTTIVNEQLKPETYEVEWDGTNFPSGVYYYKLTAGEYSETKKMVLVR